MNQKRKSQKTMPVPDADQRLFFVYRDGLEAYAVPPTSVVEIITKTEATPVPFTPDWLDGVISVRGEIMPVLDLLRYFKLPSTPSKQRNRLILVNVEGAAFTMWSDQIIGVESIEESRLEQPLSNLPDSLQKCLFAQFRMSDSLVYCIDLKKLLKEARDHMKTL